MERLTAHIQSLKSSDQSTRETAARALTDLGADARLAVPALLDALLSESDACPSIGTAIVTICPTVDDIPRLRDALHSLNSHVRFWASRAIVKLGPDASPLIPELIGLLCDPHHPVTDSVAWALGSIGRNAISPLIHAANQEDSQLRSRAIWALGRYPEHIAAKLPTILDALDADDPIVRKSAACATCSLAQSAHPDAAIYEKSTLAALVSAVERILADPSIDIEPDWPRRLLGWLSPNP